MAAQLLSGQGFKEVYNLKGGIQAWQGVKAVGPVELNLDLIRGDESPGEMITLVYGMEEALRRYYLYFSKQRTDSPVRDLFHTLAAVEEKHQALLQKAWLGLGPRPGTTGAPDHYGFRAGPGRRFQIRRIHPGKRTAADTETAILELAP